MILNDDLLPGELCSVFWYNWDISGINAYSLHHVEPRQATVGLMWQEGQSRWIKKNNMLLVLHKRIC